MPKDSESNRLKVIKGVRPGRINRNEPKPSGRVQKPRFLKGRGADLWRQYAPGLVQTGVMKASDVHMFAILCSLLAAFEENPPGFGAARLAQLRGLAKNFGMTPTSRTSIIADPPLGKTTRNQTHGKKTRAQIFFGH